MSERCYRCALESPSASLPSPSPSVTLPGLRLPASASLSLASCWPRPQQLLPVSAAGGGRRRCSQRERLSSGADPIKCITLLPVGHTAQRKEGLFVQTFYKICLILMIVGGINWGLVGLFSSTSSAGCWAAARPSGHASCSRWWVWPLSAASRACSRTRPGNRDKRKRLSCRQEIRHESLFENL